MASGYSPGLPISRDMDDGFTLTKTLQQVSTQNLKNVIFTNPGERIMDPKFGVGIKKFLFEMNDELAEINLNEKIVEQVSKYLPYITIQNIHFQRIAENENLINLLIVYKIPTTTKEILASFPVSAT